jgi:hypothetical protein
MLEGANNMDISLDAMLTPIMAHNRNLTIVHRQQYLSMPLVVYSKVSNNTIHYVVTLNSFVFFLASLPHSMDFPIINFPTIVF